MHTWIWEWLLVALVATSALARPQFQSPQSPGYNWGYSGHNDGYSGHNGGYPDNRGGNPGYSGGNPGYSGGNPGYGVGNPGYSGGYPGNSGGIQGFNGGYPGFRGGYPAAFPFPTVYIFIVQGQLPESFPGPLGPGGSLPESPKLPLGGFGGGIAPNVCSDGSVPAGNGKCAPKVDTI